jgi:hypothetical protein
MFFILLILLTIQCTKSTTQNIKVRLLSSLERITKYENFDHRINYKFRAARQEWLGFQIALRTENDTLNNLSLNVSKFINLNGSIIDSINFRRYREHFIKINKSSHLAELPPDWYPDALIPFLHPESGEELYGKYNASPYTLLPGENVVYYIEIKIHKNVPPSEYNGFFTFTWDTNQSLKIPVGLTVYNFTFPDHFIMPSLFGGTGAQFNQLFSSDLPTAKNLFTIILLEHRIQPSVFSEVKPKINMDTGDADFSIVQERIKYLMDTLNLRIFPIPVFIDWPFQNFLTSDKNKFINYLQSYESYFSENGWNEKLCAYIIDEPNLRECFYISYNGDSGYLTVKDSSMFLFLDTIKIQISFNDSTTNTIDKVMNRLDSIPGIEVSKIYRYIIPGVNAYNSIIEQNIDLDRGGYVKWTQYELVRQIGDLIHKSAPSIKHLTTEQIIPTIPSWDSIGESVDIWCPLFPLFDKISAYQAMREGDEIWVYTALCQPKNNRITPFWQLDFPLLNYRLPFWLMHKYNISGLLYWGTSFWNISNDPWQNPISYRLGEYVYNGEGSLLYPGFDAGFFGLCSSLRMKAIRDGVEDFYYLQLADSLGLLKNQIKNVATDWDNWNSDPNALLRTRDQLARHIEEKVL